MAPSDTDVRSFHVAAHLGLRVLDARGGRRRFGDDADARWKQFRGQLTEADRFDLLLRDAATVAPLAFAPRDVFGFTGLSTEDPFGPDWAGPPRGLSGEFLRSREDAPIDPVAAFDRCLAAWERPVRALDPGTAPRVVPATRLLVGGTSALRHLVAVFAAARDTLDLADQVILVADQACDRQLFGLAAVFLGTTNPPRCVAPGVKPERWKALGVTRLDATLVSDDASDAVRAAVADFATLTAR
ncbi:MAG: hypothetical protein Q7V43_27800 [Myxococcales bacterium]|nr:hypothetical protein [Myxococcales bacterium]